MKIMVGAGFEVFLTDGLRILRMAQENLYSWHKNKHVGKKTITYGKNKFM